MGVSVVYVSGDGCAYMVLLHPTTWDYRFKRFWPTPTSGGYTSWTFGPLTYVRTGRV